MSAANAVRRILDRSLVYLVLWTLCIGACADARAGDGGPEREIEYFKIRHAPYGAAIPADVLKSMWDKVLAMPSEPASISGTYQWTSTGPYGFNVNYSGTGLGRFAGRILDLEINSTIGTRFAAASGGLWGYAGIAPYPLSDQLTSLVVSSFATLPGNTNTIIVGTGEFSVRGGTGVWRTTNAGQSWTAAIMTPVPTFVFKLRYDPVNTSVVHAATSNGYYRSTDGGVTWAWNLSGAATDLCFAQTESGPRVYVPCWGSGLFSSTDNGITWSPISSAVLPTSDMGRTAMSASSVDPAVSASHVYMSAGRAGQSSQLNGLYRSDDGGLNWVNITPPSPFGANQLFYDNAIAVCPANFKLVIVGWVKDHRSTDAGQTWTLIDNLNPDNHDNTHDDWHVIRWTDNGGAVYAGNDGGLSFSPDSGVTWTSVVNNAPITQFYGIDVAGVNGQSIVGGAQDNGVVTTNDGGTSWIGTLCCDGGSPEIDRSNTARVYSVMNGNRYRSTDGGYTWGNIDHGLGTTGIIKTDGGSQTASPIVYTTVGSNVYYSTDFGGTWNSMTAVGPLPAGVADLEVPEFNSAGPRAYAVMGNNGSNAAVLYYYLGTWYDVSSGLPGLYYGSQRVVRVRMHPTDQATVYAVMNGVDPNADGNKLFKSTDSGFHWSNITGNMPNIPLTDIAIDPNNDNNLYLGSEMGCFRTSDGGSNWLRWNDGMPQANIISELKTTYNNGVLYVVAGSYGRSTWIRGATSFDPGKYVKLHTGFKLPIVPQQNSLDTIQVNSGDVNGFLSSLIVRIDTLIHPSVGELVITLHHGGLEDTLYNRSAPAGVPGTNFMGTLFDDGSPMGIGDGLPPFTGAFRPLRPLAQFNNLPPEGPWVLDVFQAAGTDTGSLNAWGIAMQPETPTSVAATNEPQREFMLGQNYPNPFNPSSEIGFQIAEVSRVTLKVYDLLGREVATLVNEVKQPGRYEVRFDGSRLASGVYLCRLQAASFTQTRKLVLLK